MKKHYFVDAQELFILNEYIHRNSTKNGDRSNCFDI